jgi:murein DD-endopeptidase MepM/ murein hydrolase activator NlpD
MKSGILFTLTAAVILSVLLNVIMIMTIVDLTKENKVLKTKQARIVKGLEIRNPHGLYKYELIDDGFVYPIENEYAARVTSEFMAHDRLYHDGADIGSKIKHVRVVQDGFVRRVYKDDYFGLCVEIEHGNYISIYKHLARVIIKDHEVLRRGQVVGYMGSSGFGSQGVHLHWTLLKWDDTSGSYEKVNPFRNGTRLYKYGVYYVKK